jgi:hypothetical protein
LDGLPTGAKYRFQVVAINGVGTSAPSPWSEPLGADRSPPAPAEVTVSRVNYNSARPAGGGIDVSWAAVSAPAGASAVNGYRVEIYEDGGLIADLRAAASDTSIPTYWGRAGSAYSVRVAAVNDSDTLDWNWQTSATVTAAGPPVWGGGLSADASGMNLSWSAADRRGAPESPVYFVWRSSSEVSASCPADPATGATASTTATTWSDSEPLADGTYWFAVYAVTPWGCAGDVTSVTVTTVPGTASYGEATLTALDASTTRITVVSPTVDRAAALVAVWQVQIGASWFDLVADVATASSFTFDAPTGDLASPFTITIRGCTAEGVCGASGGSATIPVPTFGE